MSEDTYDDWMRRFQPRAAGEDDEEDPPGEGYRAYGLARSPREQVFMLEFRLRTGEVVAFGYPWLQRAGYDPSVGVTLHFSGARVEVRGRNLGKLFAAVSRHRVRWIGEADRPTAQLAPDGEAVVTGLAVSDA